MKPYLKLCKTILKEGIEKTDRTGTGTKSIFGYQMRFNLNKGFPLLTTKEIHIKSVIYELLWFLKGDTNIQYLKQNNVSIWNHWANKNGDLGAIYGKQWRNWNNENIDQIQQIINTLKTDPHSRRIIVSSWNPSVLPDTSISFSENIERGKQALPPCHTLFQFYTAENKLSCQLYQRSGDVFLGIPFNIASYALLTMMVAQVTQLELGDYIHTLGDAHIYKNHFEQVHLQLKRKPKSLPKMIINPKVNNIFDFKYEDFILENYNPYPKIKGNVAV